MATNTYTVTKRAGPRVAGRAAEPGQTIELTPAEAEYELREGTIVAGTDDLDAAFTKASPAMDGLRADAARVKAIARGAGGSIHDEPAPAEPAPAEPAPAEPAPDTSSKARRTAVADGSTGA